MSLSVLRVKLSRILGIGDPDILKNAGIDVRLNLPGVGSNFQVRFTFSYEDLDQ